MRGWEPQTYGDRVAEIYDAWVQSRAMVDTEGTVEFLARAAGAGPVLELAIGTGRVALPLARRGIEVHGIDASEAMVAKLRAKRGGEAIPVTLSDMADVAVEGSYPLVYIVFNTLFGLLTQEDQIRCFRNVAARLAPGGAFVVEAFLPDLSRFDRGQRVGVTGVDLDALTLEASAHDAVNQRISTQMVVLTEAEGVRLYPIHLRYVWPSELDLMARLAGLRLRERWGGWRGDPFTAASARHVSVYER